jgi:hypothetical protein
MLYQNASLTFLQNQLKIIDQLHESVYRLENSMLSGCESRVSHTILTITQTLSFGISEINGEEKWWGTEVEKCRFASGCVWVGGLLECFGLDVSSRVETSGVWQFTKNVGAHWSRNRKWEGHYNSVEQKLFWTDCTSMIRDYAWSEFV